MNRKKRTTALRIVISMTVLIIPCAAAAAAPQEGDKVTTDYKDVLTGSDGENFRCGGSQTSIGYRKDGSIYSFEHTNYSGPRKHYKICTSNGGGWWAYCIEQGVTFPDVSEYSGKNTGNDEYFRHLPQYVRDGIMLASIFGRQPGKSVPVRGCNDDDWYWATQVIIWEYQQQLRKSPDILSGNGYIPADYFRKTLKGRPSEKCYEHILKSMEEYCRIPSFAARTKEKAPEHILKYSYENDCWSLSLDDENNAAADIRLASDDLTVVRQGSHYVISSRKPLAVQEITAVKDIKLPSHEMLIWGNAGKTQSLMTGTKNPIKFFIKVRTESSGSVRIEKSAEDDLLEGHVFTVSGSGITPKKLVSGPSGSISSALYPGTYNVTEQTEERYRENTGKTFIVKENEVTAVNFNNILKKGRIGIRKMRDRDNMKIFDMPEAGAVFEIYDQSCPGYDAAPDLRRDVITTDEKGYACTEPLPCGNYIVTQKSSFPGTEPVQDFAVAVNEDMKTYLFDIKDPDCTVTVDVVKKDAESGKVIAKAGTGYKVRSISTGRYLEDGGTFFTGETGRLHIPVALSWGSYELIETSAPENYVLNRESLFFEINGSSEDNVTVVQKDVPQKARIRVVKIAGNGDAGEKPLPGAVFKIRAAEDITGCEGSRHMGEGEKAACITTGENGEAVTPELFPGRYDLIEVKAPEGYRKSRDPVTHVILEYRGQEEKTYTKKVVIKNEAELPPETSDGMWLWLFLSSAAASAVMIYVVRHNR